MTMTAKDEKDKSVKLHILQVHNCYQNRGGEEAVVEAERKMLTQRGHKVFPYIRDNQEIEGASLVRKLWLSVTSIFSLSTYFDICYRIQRYDIDVVHVHNTIHLVTPSVFWAAKKCHVPVVMTAHNYRLCCGNGCFYREGKICEQCLEKNSFGVARHKCYRDSFALSTLMGLQIWLHQRLHTYQDVIIIALNPFQKEKLAKVPGIKRKQIAVKPNFYKSDMKKTEASLENESSKKDAKQRERAFLFAGRICEEKGIMELLKSYADYCKQCQDVEPHMLYVAGQGPMMEEAKTYCADKGLHGVFFLGQIPEWQVVEFMRQVSYVIVPSKWYEGFPMVVAEANEAKTPVLASDLGALGSLIQKGHNGFVYDPEDTKGLAHLMMDVTLQPDAYACDFKGLPDYSEEANYQRLMDIYHKTIVRCNY